MSDNSVRLRNILQTRLELMPEVAMFKWNQKIPVLDDVREQQLRDKLVRDAMKLGIQQKTAIILLQGQMDAAKHWQMNLIQEWEEKNIHTFKDIRDLTQEIRLDVSRISQELLELIAGMLKEAETPDFIKLETAPQTIPKAVWNHAIMSIRDVFEGEATGASL